MTHIKPKFSNVIDIGLVEVNNEYIGNSSERLEKSVGSIYKYMMSNALHLHGSTENGDTKKNTFLTKEGIAVHISGRYTKEIYGEPLNVIVEFSSFNAPITDLEKILLQEAKKPFEGPK